MNRSTILLSTCLLLNLKALAIPANELDLGGNTQLMSAIYNGEKQLINEIISSNGCNFEYLNTQNMGNRTALHLAALNGDVELYNLLSEKGANKNIRDYKNKKASDYLNNL